MEALHQRFSTHVRQLGGESILGGHYNMPKIADEMGGRDGEEKGGRTGVNPTVNSGL
jgi:hypothetical protein